MVEGNSNDTNRFGMSKVALAAYEDLLSPAAKEIGQNLVVVAKVMSLALAPVEASVWGYEQIKSWLNSKLADRLSNVDASKIEPPPLHIAGPVIMKMAFAKDVEYLKELYASLLATSMLDGTVHLAHPSFAHAIEQLSPDEANILAQIWKFLVKNDNFELSFTYSEYYDPHEMSVEKQFSQLVMDAGAEFPDQSDSYMDNLIRLRLLEFNRHSAVEHRSIGELQYTHPSESVVSQSTFESLALSAYGKQFVLCCCVGSGDT